MARRPFAQNCEDFDPLGYKGALHMRAHHLLRAFGIAVAAAACAASAPASSPPGAGLVPVAPAREVGLNAELVPDAAPAMELMDATLEANSSDASSVAPVAVSAAASSTSACNEQPPQDFLIRGNFLKAPGGNQRAIQYRTDMYGFFKGFGRASGDAQPPSHYIVGTTFMGLPIRMHQKVVPATQVRRRRDQAHLRLTIRMQRALWRACASGTRTAAAR